MYENFQKQRISKQHLGNRFQQVLEDTFELILPRENTGKLVANEHCHCVFPTGYFCHYMARYLQ